MASSTTSETIQTSTHGDAPDLKPTHAARFLWNQLTSMRTALALLFIAALAAVPGSFVPQRPVNPQQVRDFMAEHPRLGPLYDSLGVFDVYASPWFAAIYLLLLVSLVGCIIPRIGTFARALGKPPPATPRNLGRLPEHRALTSDTDTTSVDQVLDRAAAALAGRRFRVRRDADALSAERGYLREFGNLVFHLSLVAMLLGTAWTTQFGYTGSAVVIEGRGFSNTLTQYDEFTAGAGFRESQLTPFTIVLQRFTARFETGTVQRGAAREFRADTTVRIPGQPEQTTVIEVNHPLSVGGTDVHLSGHGYAAVVRVTDGEGNLAYSGPVVFLPQDGNFTSYGVVKVPDAVPKRLAFEGYFLPTATVDQLGPRSLFPDAYNPEVFLNAWSGPPAAETGRPENVYSLDTTGLTQVSDSNGEKARFRLRPGETYELPGDQGSFTLVGWQRWTKLQVSYRPGMWLTLGSVLVGVGGLCLSLFVRPRRLWVRVRRGDDATLHVEVAGLDRADARTGLADDVEWLAGVAVPEPERSTA